MQRTTFARALLIAAIATLVVAPTAYSQMRSGLGLGIMVGEPTGISAITWLGGGNAADLVAAWSFGDSGSFYLHADYQFHAMVENPLSAYAGVGGFVLLKDTPLLGIRFPLGLTVLFQEVPLDFFLEVAPGMTLVQETDFFMGGGIGFRFYF